jgi:hypothetical protein
MGHYILTSPPNKPPAPQSLGEAGANICLTSGSAPRNTAIRPLYRWPASAPLDAVLADLDSHHDILPACDSSTDIPDRPPPARHIQ